MFSLCTQAMQVKAKEGEQLLSKVALPWRRPLSVLLQRSHDPHRLVAMATMVYRRGGKRTCESWDQLLTSLGNNHPCVDTAGNLCFQPMLLCFPETFIQGFLHFLLNQQDCVSPDSLHRFVRQLGQASGQRSPLVQPLMDRLVSLVADRCRLVDDGADEGGVCDREGGGGKDVLVRHGAVELDSASVHPGDKSESGVRDKSTVDIHCADRSKRGMSCGSGVGLGVGVGVGVGVPPCQDARESKSVCVSRSGAEDGRSKVCSNLSGITRMHSQHLTDLDAHTATLPSDLHPATLRSPSSSKRSERSCAVKDAQEADSSVIVVDSDGEEEVCVAVETGGSVGRDEADHRAVYANSQVDTTPAQLDHPGHGVADIEAEYKGDVQRLREALSSGEEDAPGDLDLDFLAALPASQVAAVCQGVGLAAVQSFLLPDVLQRVVTLSNKLSHGASTALVQAIITHTLMSMEETASRDMTSCLSDLAAAFPEQLAAVLCDCLQQAPLSSVQAEVMSSVCKSWDPPALLGFIRGVCRSDRQVDQHLVTVLQSAVNRHVDLNPDDLLAVLRVLETGAFPLAADVKYGRLVLTLVRAHRKQMTSLHSAVLHSIAGVHTSLVRKSLRSLVDSLPSLVDSLPS
ncbi:hypothetical protein V1264_005098 [Littorina saxatilis]|uniref:Fanconi Anaemia group E protein C-terminal domain-containing protein n=1 Tax=Littorina saxatilis TaxID=31220 RepID=A0AAN9B0Q1_9CAEN